MKYALRPTGSLETTKHYRIRNVYIYPNHTRPLAILGIVVGVSNDAVNFLNLGIRLEGRFAPRDTLGGIVGILLGG